MNILITGGSKGIGFQLVRSFIHAGGNTIGIISRSPVTSDLLREAEEHNNRLLSYTVDLADFPGHPEELTKRIFQDFDRLDILVNNAGTLIVKPFNDLQISDYLHSFTVNFLAPVLLIRELLPLFSGSSVKHIINIGSMGGYQGSEKYPGLSAYSASKAALANITESLAVELKDQDIHINCLAPGAVQTEMLSRAFPGFRAPVTPEEMGEFIYRFAVSAGRVMNGQIIPVSLSSP